MVGKPGLKQELLIMMIHKCVWLSRRRWSLEKLESASSAHTQENTDRQTKHTVILVPARIYGRRRNTLGGRYFK